MREIRCSSLHRFMNCVGHKDLTLHEPNEAGDAAREGTAIGEYLTAMIEQKTSTPVFNHSASNGFFINDYMKYFAKSTYEAVLVAAEGNPIRSEERIDWQAGNTLIRGQYDISFITGGVMKDNFLQDATLHVYDLKYGYGIVEVEDNWQLLGYAIGEHRRLLSQGIYIKDVVFQIHQPRAYHPQGIIRTWTITKEELMSYYHKIVNQSNLLDSGVKDLSTGSSCKYCDASAHCPALNKAFHNAIDVILNDYTEAELDNEGLVKLLSMLERAEEVVKIKGISLRNLAISRLQANQVIQGYGMVQKYGDRQWKDGVTTESIKLMTGIDVSKVTMMSPAQAEKAGVNKKLVEHLAIKPSRGFELGKIDLNKQAEKLFNK